MESEFFTFEIRSPRQEAPIIHAALGRLIVGQKLNSVITPPDGEQTVDLLNEANSCFNPKLVSWTELEESGIRIPVILRQGMEKMEDDFSKGSCERVFNSMTVGATKTPGIPALRKYLLLDGKKLHGFRAESFTDLVLYLSRPPYQHPVGFSSKSLEFMYTVNDNLYASSQ